MILSALPLVLAAIAQRADPDPAIGSNLFIVAEHLQCKFLVRGTLTLGVVGVGEPERRMLALQTNGRVLPVRSLGALRGKVSIRSSDEALDYVRLRTCPSLQHDVWENNILEVLPRRSVTMSIVFGDADDYHMLRRDDDWKRGLKANVDAATYKWLSTSKTSLTDGIVEDQWFDERHLSNPKLTPIQNGWLVERFVFLGPFRSVSIWRIREEVTRDGGYSWSELRRLAIDLPSGAEGMFNPFRK